MVEGGGPSGLILPVQCLLLAHSGRLRGRRCAIGLAGSHNIRVFEYCVIRYYPLLGSAICRMAPSSSDYGPVVLPTLSFFESAPWYIRACSVGQGRVV